MSLQLQPGDLIDDKYVVEDVIGEGGMGVVVAARHRELGTPVAVKVLRPRADGVWRHRFLREARAASQIDSEHIARVFDVGRFDDGTPYMVMELLVGCDLADIIYGQGPLEVAAALQYATQACEALAAAHQHGIVHRDVKPANLFLTHRDDGSPCVKLLDFGISKVTTQTICELTRTGSFLGSPQFMSPEQLASSRDVDARSDLWSLGAALFEMLTANAAFAGETVAELYSAILRDRPRQLRHYRPDAPAALEAIIERCLEKDVAARVQSAHELSQLLSAVDLDEKPIELSQPPSARSVALEATELLDHDALEDWFADEETPTVRPVSITHGLPEPPRRLGLVGGGLFAGALGGAALVAMLSSVPARLAPIPPAPQVVVATAEPPAPPPSERAEASRFVESSMLDEQTQRDLDAELVAAHEALAGGDDAAAVERARRVIKHLDDHGVSPNRAISAIGARAQLILGRVRGAEVHALLQKMPEPKHAKTWVNQLAFQLAHARVAYDRVNRWGVRSFYRCSLVEMAELDHAASQAVAQLGEQGDPEWFASRARNHKRHARTGLRHALQVKAETVLCLDEARAARARIGE